MLSVLFILPYQLMMAYGVLTLAGFWASPSASSSRDIPEPLFLTFGLAIPLVSWIFSTFSAFSAWTVPLALTLPVSLGFLYTSAQSAASAGNQDQRALEDADLQEADRKIASDPRDASAYWSKAQVYERQGRFELALIFYEKTHEISDRTLPAPELADIRERLEHALARRRDNQSRRAGGWRPDALFLACGFAYFLWNWVYAVNLCSLMLFIHWLRADVREA